MRASSGTYRHVLGSRSAAPGRTAGTVPPAGETACHIRHAATAGSPTPLVTFPMHIPPMPQLVGIILPGGSRGVPRECADRQARGGAAHGHRFARKAICLARKPRNPNRKGFCLAHNVVGPCTQRFLARAQGHFGRGQAKEPRARSPGALRARFMASRSAEKALRARLRGRRARVFGTRSGQSALRVGRGRLHTASSCFHTAA